MNAWRLSTVRGIVNTPRFAFEPPLGRGIGPGYPYPIVEQREPRELTLEALPAGDKLIVPSLGGLAWAEALSPGAADGPLLALTEDGEPVLWRLDPASGLTVRCSGWPTPQRHLHNPTARSVAVPAWLGTPELTLAPGESWPAPTDSPWRDPRLVAELVLAGECAEPLPTSYALAAAGALLALDRANDARALLHHPLSDSPGVPPGLVPFVRAFVAGDEPPWRWELEWGPGFACGRLARLALAYAVACHDDVLAHYQLGCVLADWGRWDQACVHWAAATEGPDAAEANRNLGYAAHHHYADDGAARAFYREALAIGVGPITGAEAAELGVTG